MADIRNLGLSSGGVGTARFVGSASGIRNVGGGQFFAELPTVSIAHSPLTTRLVDCAAGNNTVYLHDNTSLVMIIAPVGNTAAISVGESTDAATQLELNPNGFIAWTPKMGVGRSIIITAGSAVSVTLIEL